MFFSCRLLYFPIPLPHFIQHLFLATVCHISWVLWHFLAPCHFTMQLPYTSSNIYFSCSLPYFPSIYVPYFFRPLAFLPFATFSYHFPYFIERLATAVNCSIFNIICDVSLNISLLMRLAISRWFTDFSCQFPNIL